MVDPFQQFVQRLDVEVAGERPLMREGDDPGFLGNNEHLRV